MSRKSEKPSAGGCKSEAAPYTLVGLFRTRHSRDHDWRYSSGWNGNDRNVLPFTDYPHGISRSGWRCYHCGGFAWDQSDREFALSYAFAMGLIKLPEPDSNDVIGI